MMLGVGLSPCIPTQSATVQDAILAAGPIAYLHADQGYYTDGCLRVGKVKSNFDGNYAYSASTDFRTGNAASWSWTGVVKFLAGSPAISGVQCILAKRGASNNEFALTRDASGYLTLTVYDATAGSSLAATSTVAIAADTQAVFCCGYDQTANKLFIKVNSETKVQSSTLSFTIPASGTANLRIGYDPVASRWGYFDIDSLGWAKGYAFSDADMTELVAGKRFQDLSAGLVTAFTQSGCAWWDFGSVDCEPVAEDRWPWLEDQNSNAHSLSTTAGSYGHPYMVPGLIAPLQTGDAAQGGLLWAPDASGNDNYFINHFVEKVRGGYDADGWADGTPCFYFEGTKTSTHAVRISGRGIYCPGAGPPLSGLDSPFTMLLVGKLDSAYKFGPDADAEHSYFGVSFGGPGRMGYVPHAPWGDSSLASGEDHHTFTFMCPSRADNVSPRPFGRIYTQRSDHANHRSHNYEDRQWSLDNDEAAIFCEFDGSTGTVDWNGVTVIAETMDTNNVGGLGGTDAIESQTFEAFFVGCFAAYTDTLGGFSGSGIRFWGFNDGFPGKIKLAAIYDRVLTTEEKQAIRDQLTPALAVGPAFHYAASTTNLVRWHRMHYGPFVERSSQVTRAYNDADLVGTWGHSIQLTDAWCANGFVADIDGNRPVIAVESGTAGIYIDGTAGKRLGLTLTQAQPLTVICAIKVTRNSGTGSWYEFIWIVPTTNLEVYSYGTTFGLYGTAEIVSSALTHGSWGILTCVCNGASSKIRWNGTQIASGNIGSSGISSAINLAYAASHPGKVSFRDLMIYSAALTDPQALAEEQAMAARASISI